MAGCMYVEEMYLCIFGTLAKRKETHAYFKGERFIKRRVERFAMDFGFKLFLLLWKQEDFDVRIGGTPDVQRWEVSSLYNAHNQLRGKI